MTMTCPRCIVVCIAVLRCCSCCCHWRTVVFPIPVYCCILFFVLFFLFLLLLLLSVVCRQRLLLGRRPSFVVRRHPLAPSCCNHGVLLFRLCRVVSRCVVSIVVRIVVLRSCSCCCPGVLAITVYCCILFFVLFFLFLLLLLLSVVCRQHLLLSRHPSIVVIRLPLLVAITVYCCFVCVALCRVVSHCFAKLWLKLIWLRLQDKKNIEFYLKNRTLYSYFLDAFSAFIQFAGTLYYPGENVKGLYQKGWYSLPSGKELYSIY